MKVSDNMGARLPEIDYLRGLGALAVVAIHVTYNFVNRYPPSVFLYMNILVATIVTFAVPLFIMISGFVLYIKYDMREKYSLRSFYMKRMLSVIPQYLLFSVIYTVYVFHHEIVEGGMSGFPTITFIKNVLTGRSYYHLWFFVVLIQLYILYPFIANVYSYFKKQGRLAIFLVGALSLQISWDLLSCYVFPHQSPDSAIGRIALKAMQQHLCVEYVFYFILGIYLCDHYRILSERIKRLPWVPIITVGVLLMTATCPFFLIRMKGASYFTNVSRSYGMVGSFLIPILDLAVIMILYKGVHSLARAGNMISSVLTGIGRYSFGIYLVHMLILQVLVAVYCRVGIDRNCWLYGSALFMGTCVLSYFCVTSLSRFPFSEYLIGVRRQRLSK